MVFSADPVDPTAEGLLQLCRRGTEVCTEKKLFWGLRKKWLAELEKGFYMKTSYRKNKKYPDESREEGERHCRKGDSMNKGTASKKPHMGCGGTTLVLLGSKSNRKHNM